MDMEHRGVTSGSNGRPIISRAVVRGDTVYLCGMLAEPGGDIKTQTRQVFAQIDQQLGEAGTDKSKLLTAQVWLADMRDFSAHNDAWNAWVDPTSAPVRACVEAKLWLPGILVEIMVTAVKP